MLPIFQRYDSHHRRILDTLDILAVTMLKRSLEARTRALERIKESFNFFAEDHWRY